MQPAERQKFVNMMYPQLKDDGDFANNTYVDTKGWGHLRVLFIVGATDTTIGSTAEGTAPKLEHCDTSGGTYADISSAALSASIAADDDGEIKAIDIDLTRGDIKRYVEVNAPHAGNGSTGANMAIIGILSKPCSGSFAGSATEAGLAELVQV